jgi:hypothetical protein
MQAIWAGVVALILCGCSTFDREWKQALKNPRPNGIDGAWAGEWRSEKNKHHGALRCVLSQKTATAYHARFHARFLKIFQYTSETMLYGFESNGVVQLAGESDLGTLAGGVYHYKGTVTPTEFKSTYKSKYDHGRYEMVRPKN